MSLINEVKQDLFTIKGLAVTLLTDLIIIGLLGSWIFINVEVLGNDVAMSLPTSEAVQSYRRK
ncbi:MAG: hypothetical protein EBX40_07260 [Gammaproteobacteria bacterium]|nr:hypothetical protein [Gammaproteobacteria bacterium]